MISEWPSISSASVGDDEAETLPLQVDHGCFVHLDLTRMLPQRVFRVAPDRYFRSAGSFTI